MDLGGGHRRIGLTPHVPARISDVATLQGERERPVLITVEMAQERGAPQVLGKHLEVVELKPDRARLVQGSLGGTRVSSPGVSPPYVCQRECHLFAFVQLPRQSQRPLPRIQGLALIAAAVDDQVHEVP